MSRLVTLKKELNSLGSSQKAKASAWFFKTGKGEYGEGDKFIGVTLPEQRGIAKKYFDLPLKDIERLLNSPIHEHRSVALIILVNQYQKSDKKKQKEIFNFYLSHTKRINNWDLVDCSAGYIVGGYLIDKQVTILSKLTESKNIWERRISILATFKFIYNGRYKETFLIAEKLLADKHDLIHKAVGWMLRETGKRCGEDIEEEFLKKHYKKMPRTSLRYAIERFSKEKKFQYLKGLV
ncbi:DNA alkylation repair protein [Candidatus Gottesmanbacteria bacterium RIFCSPHIGHO2_02_FULL_39_11]|uniref:DNA alkylation repair protein n=1 Tax=Candidatus Gottesmanbacteria bacterium RIFCSPHIGHO2_02_FULL_39_11 TaxID=1798382 RepID=A0A1F5ZSM8_9BACT|nr:MAG: DNA alkylation repair protein [Candidatus Gottesmanbacteria bacterium RIFCSPHIGHO2_02_FULL_39_11]